jgi:integrase
VCPQALQAPSIRHLLTHGRTRLCSYTGSHCFTGPVSRLTPEESILFETFLKAGARKKELMFLEDDDLIVETLAPGLVRREVRITSNDHWRFTTKNGKTRYVPISADLMDKLLTIKAKVRPSKLLSGTSKGKPDYHMLDTLHTIAEHAGFDPSQFWLHKFRSPTVVPSRG